MNGTKKPTSYSDRRRIIRRRSRVANTPLNQRLSRRAGTSKRGGDGNASVLTVSRPLERSSSRTLVKPLTPTLRCSLSLPQIGPSVPALLIEGSSAYHTAYIAEGFYKAGILRDIDWNGDLSSTLQVAINRWVLFDCRCQLVAEGLGLEGLTYTDSVETQDYVSLNPRGDKMGIGYSRGGLFINNSFASMRYDLGFMCSKFNSIEPRLGSEIFCVLAYFVHQDLSGMTPWLGLDSIIEWAYNEGIEPTSGDEGHQRAMEIWGVSEKSIREENPPEILVESYKDPSSEIMRAFTTKAPDPYFGNEDWNLAHTVSLKALELLELERRLLALPSDPDQHNTELDAPPSPTIFLNWHPGVENSLARWADTYYQYEMDGERTAVVFMRGFWIPPRGVFDNSLSLAIQKIELELKILSILHELLFELDSQEPVPVPVKQKKGKPLADVLGLKPAYNEEDFIDRL